MKLKEITWVGIVVFAFAYMNILLFGFFGYGIVPSLIFQAGYFAFSLVFILTCYFTFIRYIHPVKNTRTDKIIAISTILLISFGLSGIAMNLDKISTTDRMLKKGVAQISSDLDYIQSSTEYYEEYFNLLSDKSKEIGERNSELKDEIEMLEEKISNKEPVIVETIVEVPAEQVPQEEVIAQPAYLEEMEEDDYYENDEREGEDDE